MIRPGRKRCEQEAERKHGKNCKACGKWFVYRDRFYCSVECRKSVQAKPVVFNCSQCGKESARDSHKVKNPDRIFCNATCQREFQKSNGASYQSKGLVVVGAKTKKKLELVKRQWKAKQRQERQLRSAGFEWWRKCKSSAAEFSRIETSSQWDRRFASASSLLKKRRDPVFKLESVKACGWHSVVAANKKRLRIDQRRKEDIEWSNKINRTARSCKRRLQARSKSGTGSCG